MTLRFFNNQGKPDTRKIEYEQDIVRLGLEKAELEKECGAVRTDIDVLQHRRSDLELEVEGKKKEIVQWDQKAKEARERVAEAILVQSKDVDKLKEEEELVEKVVAEKKTEIDELQKHIDDLGKEISDKSERIVLLNSEISRLRDELSEVRGELLKVRRELEEAQVDLKDTVVLKVRANKELNDAVIEKNEVEEQVKTLKSDNRGGLDVLASLESERARLKGRDEALDRKEADLAVYENRLAKRARDLGVDLKMTFK